MAYPLVISGKPMHTLTVPNRLILIPSSFSIQTFVLIPYTEEICLNELIRRFWDLMESVIIRIAKMQSYSLKAVVSLCSDPSRPGSSVRPQCRTVFDAQDAHHP